MVSMDAENFVSSLSSVYGKMYDNYEKVLIIPALMLLLSAGILALNYVQSGEFVSKGIDFTGGTSVQIQVSEDVNLQDVRGVFGAGSSVRIMSSGGEERWILIETQETINQKRVENMLEGAGISYQGDISIRRLGSAVGEAFFRDAVLWSAVALLIMSSVILIAFRSAVPSLAVIFAAMTDILFAMAAMSLLGIDLTLGSLAALLMLLGYSVDTDILLSTRVLKQHRDDLKDRIVSSIITGSTMTFAAIVAFLALLLVSPSPTLDQIASVIVIGLVADLPVTWLGNAGVLKMYVER